MRRLGIQGFRARCLKVAALGNTGLLSNQGEKSINSIS